MSLEPQFAQQRQVIRNEIRQRRRALTPTEQQDFARQIALRLTQHPRIQAAEHIAVFLSFDGELDTAPLITWLWQLGKQVYLPVLHPFSPGNLLFLRYTAQTQLIYNRFKILEPALDVRGVLPLSQLDVVLTPLVAFDAQGQRLGMGGGFYDRTLQNWWQSGPYPIGLAHDCQQVAALPVEQWDIPLPEIITPSKNWAWPIAP
jgi:5-formyltetrahydrofolate cyclo-ligase